MSGGGLQTELPRTRFYPYHLSLMAALVQIPQDTASANGGADGGGGNSISPEKLSSSTNLCKPSWEIPEKPIKIAENSSSLHYKAGSWAASFSISCWGEVLGSEYNHLIHFNHKFKGVGARLIFQSKEHVGHKWRDYDTEPTVFYMCVGGWGTPCVCVCREDGCCWLTVVWTEARFAKKDALFRVG